MILLLCYIMFWTGTASALHDIHVSRCDIEVNDQNELEVTFKIFLDDIQMAMGLSPNLELDDTYEGSDMMIEKFLNKNLKIYQNNQQLKLEYIESTPALPAVWTTVKYKLNREAQGSEIKVYNYILIDEFSDQTNLIDFRNNREKKSFVLNKKKTSVTFKL